jgi:FMN-dependent NADH-azoreductase
MQLLHVDSSILGANSASRQLTADVVEAERRRVPGLEVVYRDLAAEPLGHISGGHLGAAQATGLELPEELQRDVALGQAALAEFLASDIVVVRAEGLAMGDNRVASMEAAHSAIAALA